MSAGPAAPESAVPEGAADAAREVVRRDIADLHAQLLAAWNPEGGRDQAQLGVPDSSTVVPGTTENLVFPALERASGRLLGSGLGVADDLAHERLEELDQPFASPCVLVTTPRTAEAIKRMSNATSRAW